MNPRIYKKHAKRALELLRSHGAPVNPETLFRSTRSDHPHGIEAKGAPIIGYMSGYYEPEWAEECPLFAWFELHYWTFIVPRDYDGWDDPLPDVTIEHHRHRISTRAIAEGWKWRGKRAIRVR